LSVLRELNKLAFSNCIVNIASSLNSIFDWVTYIMIPRTKRSIIFIGFFLLLSLWTHCA